MKYSVSCDCSHNMSTDAKTQDDAINKMLPEMKKHASEAHPDLNISDEDMMRKMRADVKQTGM